jgi:hypothetical protein
MRPVMAASARRARWLLASTSAAALVCWSGAAVADCTGTALVNIRASGGFSCFVSGPFTSTVAGVIAGQATGLGPELTPSTLTNEGEGFSSFSTSADNTPAVQADSGGLITLNAASTTGTVTTSGAGSIGLLATGLGESETPAPSQITVEGVTVSTSGAAVSGGPTANGIEVDDGAMAKITNGSVTTAETANGAIGVAATGGAQITITGTTINSNGNGSQGLFVTGPGSSLTASGVTITANGDNDPVTGFNPGVASNNAFDDESSAGGKLSISGSTLTTTGTQSFGVFTADKGVTALTDDTIATKGDGAFAGVESAREGQTTISGGSVTTSGIGSPALLATGAGSKITASNVAVTTNGGFDLSTDSFAFGVIASSGGSVAFSGGSITTNGPVAHGAFAFDGGSVTLSNGATILTTGDGSFGLFVNGAGASLTATEVSVTTRGAATAAFNVSAFGAYNGSASPGDPIGGTMKLTDTTILTTGTDADGVETNSGGVTTINVGSVTTSGIGSPGVLVTGAGSSVTATGLAISTSGAFDTSTSSSSNGLHAGDGAKAVFSGGSISTAGNAAYAATATGGGSISLSGTTISTTGNGSGGLGINGSGSEIDATGVRIATTGALDPVTGEHSYGIYNGSFGSFPTGGVAKLTDTTISTQGVEMHGVVTNTSGVTTILGGSIATSGAGAEGIFSENGGVTIINVSARGPTTISTSGTSIPGAAVDADGVVAYNGGIVQLTGATVTTSGAGSPGLAVHGATSSLSASGVSITTQGGIAANGDHAAGVFNGPYLPGGLTSGGFTSLMNSTITTSGAGAAGVVTQNGGVTNVSGGSVATSGQDADALVATGPGAKTNLTGAGSFSTAGNGAIGLLANQGGVISATGSVSIAAAGGVSPATGFPAAGVGADGAGSQINLATANITTSGPGAFGLVASDVLASGSAGKITVTGPLAINTTNPSAAAVGLQGNGATIAATGGGTISAAGTAIAFMGGTGQTATFDNFAIGNLSGDLVFADPSIATLNFNTTTANAGNNNLINATGGSAITLNASASMLTGAIRTDAASTANVNLTNNTSWTLTAPSTLTTLSLTHSIVVFAPPGAGGAFKTLTVNNYAGAGANIVMNVALGGSGSAGDQIIINGGKATGSTLLTINNVGGLGGQTAGVGIPLVLATNGGSVSPDAFSLANTPVAGGFKYTLEETDDSFFLVSSPTATIAGVTNSVNNVARSQQSQMITNRVLSSILLGATQQVSCSSCGGGFASLGSFALGGSGRWSLSDNTTLIGGVSYNQWSASGISVYDAPTVAGALIYDFVNWGSSRPFLEAGVGLTPYEEVKTTRTYPNGLSTGTGYSTATDRSAALFGRAGWVDRLTPIDEAAAYVDLGRSWMQTGGYSEQMTSVNPFPATVPNGLATLNVTRLGGQYTHLFNGNIEVNVSAAVAYGFGAGAGAPFNVFQFGTIAPGAIADSAWFEYGARLGYRFTDRLVVDGFLLGTAGGLAGNFVHGGVGVRYSF